MKLYHYILLLIFFLPCISFAQSNYKPGYIVKANGDTVKGYIDRRPWNNNPKNISFKTDKHSQKEEFSVKDVSAFGVYSRDNYVRYAVWVSRDKHAEMDIIIGLDTTKTLDTVYLRVLNAGKNVTLYEYTDNLKVRYYISERGYQPTELGYHEFLDNNNHSSMVEMTLYKNQLQKLRAEYQPDNTRLVDLIQNASYENVYLAEIVDKLNGLK